MVKLVGLYILMLIGLQVVYKSCQMVILYLINVCLILFKKLLVCDLNGWLLFEIRFVFVVKDILIKQLLIEILYNLLYLNINIVFGFG